MALNLFGQKVMELCTRRGIKPARAQQELADRLEDAGYGKALGIKHVKHHLNYALQRYNSSAIIPPLFVAISEALELTDAEVRELYEAFDETGWQAMQDIQDKQRARKPSIQSGAEVHEGLIPFYA